MKTVPALPAAEGEGSCLLPIRKKGPPPIALHAPAEGTERISAIGWLDLTKDANLFPAAEGTADPIQTMHHVRTPAAACVVARHGGTSLETDKGRVWPECCDRESPRRNSSRGSTLGQPTAATAPWSRSAMSCSTYEGAAETSAESCPSSSRTAQRRTSDGHNRCTGKARRPHVVGCSHRSVRSARARSIGASPMPGIRPTWWRRHQLEASGRRRQRGEHGRVPRSPAITG